MDTNKQQTQEKAATKKRIKAKKDSCCFWLSHCHHFIDILQ